VRMIVSQPKHWDRDSALLIQKSLPRWWRTFVLSKDPLVQRGTLTCLGHLGQAAEALLPELCRFLATKPKTREPIRAAMRAICGASPSTQPVDWLHFARAATEAAKRSYNYIVGYRPDRSTRRNFCAGSKEDDAMLMPSERASKARAAGI